MKKILSLQKLSMAGNGSDSGESRLSLLLCSDSTLSLVNCL